jgi:methylated-DNA-protein-cysteine methyltransferase-like protein
MSAVSTARAGGVSERYRRIYAAVAGIPRGRVSSYGEVAARAGLPGRARLVGKALAGCSDAVPWHRVLAASGRIALPARSAAYREQARRLASEGVAVARGRVAREYFRWGPELDELLWGPDRAGHLTRACRRRR